MHLLTLCSEIAEDPQKTISMRGMHLGDEIHLKALPYALRGRLVLIAQSRPGMHKKAPRIVVRYVLANGQAEEQIHESAPLPADLPATILSVSRLEWNIAQWGHLCVEWTLGDFRAQKTWAVLPGLSP